LGGLDRATGSFHVGTHTAMWIGTRRIGCIRRLVVVAAPGERQGREQRAGEGAVAELAQSAQLERAVLRGLVVACGEFRHAAGGCGPSACRLRSRAAHMLSGADTPRSVRPLRTTCCTPSTSASRALRSGGSSTMNCSAL